MAGRPTKYKEEYEEQGYKLSLLGATDKDLANFFDVDESTINKWKLDHPEFSESVKSGKERADSQVADRLFKRATGYEHPEIITASFQGKITDTMEVTKHYPPDSTAAIFWLKNRQPEKWRDRTETKTELTGKDGGPIQTTQYDFSGMTTEEIKTFLEMAERAKK